MRNTVTLLPGRDRLIFLTKGGSPSLFDWIPHHIKNAKPGDKDLLTEIQGIMSLRKPLLNELATDTLKLGEVHWLKVGSASFLQVK